MPHRLASSDAARQEARALPAAERLMAGEVHAPDVQNLLDIGQNALTSLPPFYLANADVYRGRQTPRLFSYINGGVPELDD